MITKSKVPQIRFKGFDESWKEKGLNQIVDVCSGQDYKHLESGNIPVYGTGGYMLSVNKALSYDKNAIGIGRKGTIDKPYILKAPFWTVDTLFYAVPIQDNYLPFVYSIFQRINWKQKDESTGVPSLSKIAINNIQVFSSKETEQIKIGDYFQQLDKLIEQKERKYQKLKQFKKAMLDKMFPKNGADTPEIRFKGFSGKWEEKTIGDLGDIVTGSTPSTQDKSNYGGNYLFVSPADIQNNRYIETTITTLTTKGHNLGKVIHENSILFVSIGSTIGKVAQIKNKATTNQQINAINPNKYNDSNFIYSMLVNKSQEIKKLASAQAVPIINKTSFSEIEIIIPKDLKEQKKIGNYFQKLDNQIDLQQKELEKLKNIKKASLSKMFV